MKTKTPKIEREQVKALPKETECGKLTAGMNDTAGGKKINSSSFPMGMHAGTAMVTHEGKKHEITVVHDLGASLCLSANGRNFRLNLEWFVKQAIEAGLLDDAPLDFERDMTATEEIK